MNYQIVISPDLGMQADEFVAAWNETPACRRVAEAGLTDEPADVSMIDPALLQQGLILLGSVAGGVALEAIKELAQERLKAYLAGKFPEKPPPVQVEAIRQPGGAYLIVVKEAE